MKKNTYLNKFLLLLSLPVVIMSCDSDDDGGTPIDFANVATTVEEVDGGTITIPLRNVNASSAEKLDVEFGGTAVEGEDFTLAGITAEGVQISIVDDSDVEFTETIRIKLVTPGTVGGNAMHTVSIVNNCEDTENPFTAFFRGDYNATEQYSPDPGDWYGPYDLELEPDPNNPNRLIMHNFYDAGRLAYLEFDPANGTVRFPDQQPTPDPGSPTLLTGSSGTFTIDECNHTSLTVNLNYDGGDWVYYFEKK